MDVGFLWIGLYQHYASLTDFRHWQKDRHNVDDLLSFQVRRQNIVEKITFIILVVFSAPRGSRTPNLQLRRLPLYPIELWVQVKFRYFLHSPSSC